MNLSGTYNLQSLKEAGNEKRKSTKYFKLFFMLILVTLLTSIFFVDVVILLLPIGMIFLGYSISSSTVNINDVFDK